MQYYVINQLKVVIMTRRTTKNNPVFTEEERIANSTRLNQIVRRAALTISTQGRLTPLTDKAGISYDGLILALRRGWMTGPMACAIESAVGREVLTKEELCPHKYSK